MRSRRAERTWLPVAEVAAKMADPGERWVDADVAMHCASCPTIFEQAGSGACPRCGSRQAWRVSPVLNRRGAA